VAVTASTGIAATHLGGVTIHSWSGLGVRDALSDDDLDDIARKRPVRNRVGGAGVLIIDEISMLSAQTLEFVDQIMRRLRRSPKPFGGLQIVFCGDFFQLPPVSRGQAPAQLRLWRRCGRKPSCASVTWANRIVTVMMRCRVC